MRKTFIISASYQVTPTEWKRVVEHQISSLDLQGNEEKLLLSCYKVYLEEFQRKDGTQVRVVVFEEGKGAEEKDAILIHLSDPETIKSIMRYWTNCYVGTAATENQCIWLNRMDS